jgi:glycosyltransferase involved in cell wall biosynthesis
VVITYICDLNLPPGLINRVAGMVSAVANQVAAFAACLITAMSQDYADRSVFLQRNHRKVVPVDAPVELPPVTETDLDTLRARWNILPQQRIIGMVARLAAEKGVEYLAQALPLIRKKFPQARVIYVGQYQNVLGEESYFRMLAPMIEHLGESWTFAGNISYPELAAFYRLCDVTVLPSLNSTEAFGMVQVESIISGTPVVSTDLPGVRLPVVISGMGKLVPPREAPLLANAVMDIFEHRVDYLINPAEIQRRFSPKTVAAQYEIFFRKVTSCS